jgi:hypothetical protein
MSFDLTEPRFSQELPVKGIVRSGDVDHPFNPRLDTPGAVEDHPLDVEDPCTHDEVLGDGTGATWECVYCDTAFRPVVSFDPTEPRFSQELPVKCVCPGDICLEECTACAALDMELPCLAESVTP